MKKMTAEKQRVLRGIRRRKKLCPNCGAKPKRKTRYCEKCNARKAAWFSRLSPTRKRAISLQNRKRARLLYRKLRIVALTQAGGRCKICLFADPRALQFDHVNGGGNRSRRTGREPLGSGDSWPAVRRTLARVRKGELQLLCANCNWIKKYERDEC